MATPPAAPPEPAARKAADDQVAQDWNVGDVIVDLYEVTGLLGEGGMGKVYKVHHRGWNVDLAVKSPKPQELARAGGAANFVRPASWVVTTMTSSTPTTVVKCWSERT